MPVARSMSQGDTELPAVSAVLTSAGWTYPTSEFDDGNALLGHRIFADGHGAGSVIGFQSAVIGASTHLVRLDNGTNVEIKLERKGNRQVKWMVGPPPGADSPGGDLSSQALAVLAAAPQPLPALAGAAAAGAGCCFYSDAGSVMAVGDLLLQQLAVCTEAQTRVLSSKPQPGAVRAQLEAHLLTSQAPGAEPMPLIQLVQTLCEVCPPHRHRHTPK